MKNRFANKLLLAVAPRFASGVIRLLHALLKTETLGAAHVGQYWDKDKPYNAVQTFLSVGGMLPRRWIHAIF